VQKDRSFRSDSFDARFDFPSAVLGTIPIPRGWKLADLSLRGRRFRFVNQHIEAYNNDIATAQARELVGRGGPARSSRPVILVGDLNSDPEGRGGQGAGAYNVVRAAGFTDTWARAHPGNPGFTFGLDAALRTPNVNRTIDYVFERGRLTTLRSQLFGGAPVRRQWPSDHKGLVTTLRLP
jgi:endonuclease/exonuclease/phosphatase family metal-dependent hydrolase